MAEKAYNDMNVGYTFRSNSFYRFFNSFCLVLDMKVDPNRLHSSINAKDLAYMTFCYFIT